MEKLPVYDLGQGNHGDNGAVYWIVEGNCGSSKLPLAKGFELAAEAGLKLAKLNTIARTTKTDIIRNYFMIFSFFVL